MTDYKYNIYINKCMKKTNYINHLNKKIELNTNKIIINTILNNMNNEKIINEHINDNQIKQKKGLKRNTIDKFYTKINVAELCIELVKQYINILPNDLIIEPSAGNGSFIKCIKNISNNYIFYDLEPENNEIIKQNFLEFNYSEIKKKYKNIHIIGNPPFGRQASLAIKFIKKCCEFSNSISFILPKSFKKDSLKKHFNTNFHLIYELDLDNKSFLVNNIEYDVPCVFQIWLYKNEIRNKIKKLNPINFKFVNKNENLDISFRRVGVNAGIIISEIDDKSIQSHYFIKFTNNKPVKDNIDTLKLIKFEFNNTVGPKSISKPELIKEFNKFLN